MSKKKIRKIYHYAPVSPAYTECNIKECNYYYTTEKNEVNCPDCLSKLKKENKK